MGRPKAWLEVGDTYLLRYVADRLAPAFSEVMISFTEPEQLVEPLPYRIVFDRKRSIVIVTGRGKRRGAKPRLERARAPAPRAHGLGHPGLGPRGERARARHQKPRKPIAPTMTAASTMKSPSSSMPSMVLPVASSLTKSRGSIQS